MNVVMIQPLPVSRKQGGAALVVGLVVLMMLTLLGTASMNRTSLELRIAGNTQNRNLAFQSANSMVDLVFYADGASAYRINFATTDDQKFGVSSEKSGINSAATVLYANGSAGRPPPARPTDCPGNSLNLSCNAYEITATSTHVKSSASSTQVQGLIKPGPVLGH